MTRVAFFFIGADRTGMAESVRRGELPDSLLRGANFFARRSDWQVDLISTEKFERHLPRFVRGLVPMSLMQLFFIPRLLRYDAFIASDAFLLGWILSTLSRVKWIYVAINSSVLIRRHARHPVRRWLLGRCWNSFTAIVCLAQKQKEDLTEFGIKPEKISLIRFGVDTAYFHGAAESEKGPIVSIGKDISRDYATLLEAAKQCGLPVEIIASRKNIPIDANIPGNVTVRYDLPLGELRAAYARARFAVVPLFSEENFGGDPSGQTVLLETLAMGRAVIASERSWLTEYLDTDSDILCVPPANPAALAEAMKRLWDDGALRKQLAEHGQRTVRQEYSSRRFAEELMRVVERFIEV